MILLSPRIRPPAEANPPAGRLIVPGSFVWHAPRGAVFDREGRIGAPLGGFNDLTLESGLLGRCTRGGSNRREEWTGAHYAASTSYTVIALVIDDTGRGSVRNPFDSDDPDGGGNRVFQLRFNTSNFAEFIAFNTGGSAFTSTGSVASSSILPSVLAGRVSGTEVSSWLNGTKSTTATLTGTARTEGATDARLSIGASARASAYTAGFGGQIYLCLYLPYAVSDAVLRSIKTWQDLNQWAWAQRRLFVPVSISAGTHETSGALASDAATIEGTATHLTLHATSGALASDAATVAGTATHLTLHTTEGALASEAATIAGEADHTEPGGATHTTTGALSSEAAAIAGTAAHLALHTTTGALASDAASIAGTATHLTLHTTSGALAAEAATMAGVAVHSGAGAVVDSPPGGGGWAWAAPKKKRHDYLSPPTREQMAERVRKQRIALGILPKPAQKRIEAAVKKEARRAEPDLAPLAPLAVEVAQETGTALRDVIEAIRRTFENQRGLVAARMEADAALRREEEAAAAEQARIEAEAAERAHQAAREALQRRLPDLHAADEELLARADAERQEAIKTIRQVQKALLALLDR